MNTQLQFLSNSFQFETDATITGSGEDDDGPYVVTDHTIFYPGGGGQEPDKGIIINESGVSFSVLKAKRKNSEVRHYLSEELPLDTVVKMAIDRDYRLQNTRLHTAGHLLASVVYEKLGWPLQPVKGFHYQKGAYVEFEPEKEMDEIPETALYQAVMEDIRSKLPVASTIAVPEAVDSASVFVPEGFSLPQGEPLRLVSIEGYNSVPCGGTHLHHTGEIKNFSIKQIRHKKGRIRISYRAGEEHD